MADNIIVGSRSIEVKIDTHPHFKEGRWVDDLTPYLEELVECALSPQLFDVHLTNMRPVFVKGAVVEYVPEVELRILSREQIQELLDDSILREIEGNHPRDVQRKLLDDSTWSVRL
jgi:hypothetical protein